MARDGVAVSGGGMRWLRRILIAVLVAGSAVYVFNASWRVAPPEGSVELIAHRGVHQTFSRENLTNETCTAERMDAPIHAYLENSLPSMQAAFAAGADIVELDVHPTTDGQFAVMHDWTVDCRTEGSGETRSHDMAYLRTLDLGHGYTADGGQTFPFRGTGIGLMPELKEVLAAFPDQRFLVNYKSNESREGDMLAALLDEHPEWQDTVWGAYGGDPPTYRAAELIEGLHVWSRRGLVDCLLQYEGLGWLGIVPDACRNTMVMLPVNVAPFVWGWPNLFLERMRNAGSAVILLGPYGAGDPGTAGIDTPEQLAQVPDGFSGYIWTNKIEVIGPLATDHFK
jgi:glycerophosphoryl diester phosphodiesterase